MKKQKIEYPYYHNESNAIYHLEGVEHLSDLAEYAFRQAVKGNGFRFSAKGKRNFMEMYRKYIAEDHMQEVNDFTLCDTLPDYIVRRNDFYYKEVNRVLNKRDYKALLHKVGRNCQEALGYNYVEFHKKKRQCLEQNSILHQTS